MTTIRQNPPGTEHTERNRVVRVNPTVRTNRPVPHTPDPEPGGTIKLRSIGVEGMRGKTGPQGVPGPTGPQGPPGIPGATNEVTVRRTAAIPLSGHRVVTTAADGRLIYADARHIDRAAGPFWLLGNAVVADDSTLALVSGQLTESGWTWIPGLALWLGEDGHLTQTPPGDNRVSVRLGVAVGTDTVFFSPGDPMLTFGAQATAPPVDTGYLQGYALALAGPSYVDGYGITQTYELAEVDGYDIPLTYRLALSSDPDPEAQTISYANAYGGS